MTNLFDGYRKHYHIPSLDLADAAETNRIHTLVISSLLFLFGLLDFIVVVLMHYDNLGQYFISLVYFGFYTIISLFCIVYSRKIKNISREKAYICKTIPVYALICLGIVASIYSFYIMGHPFNGVLIYCLTGFISLCTFSFSPISFAIILTAGLAAIAPGIYRHFGPSGLADSILAMVLMLVLSMYKRSEEKKYITLLKKQKKNLVVQTFGNFTLLYENKVIKFSRSKSPELIAYLIYKNGSSVKTKELISILYGDNADSARYGASLRNLIVDIKHTLAELEVQDFFISEYNNFRINPEAVKCDWYDFLAGDASAIKNFTGEFMSQYSWAEDVTGFLEMKAMEK